MNLGFKTRFDNGDLTYFCEAISLSHYHGRVNTPVTLDQFLYLHPKNHTIRGGSRWKAGNKIHLCTGLRTKNYNLFGIIECLGVQSVDIQFSKYKELISIDIDGKNMTNHANLIAKNDGLTLPQFNRWFSNDLSFKGQIIHWTKLIYK